MDDPNDIVGHKTFSTGEICPETGFPKLRHEPLTRAEADALWERAKAKEKVRAEQMPDEQSAINALFEAWQRLKELGWSDGIYCPKDGSTFEVCQFGSTGIFHCYYSGEWPGGYAMVMDDHDCYPQHPDGLMWRPIKGEKQ